MPGCVEDLFLYWGGPGSVSLLPQFVARGLTRVCGLVFIHLYP